MSPAKELFEKNRELRDKLIAVTGADWFREVLLYVRSELTESNITTEQLSGAKLYEMILMTLADSQYVAPEPLKSKLNHAIDNPRQKLETKS